MGRQGRSAGLTVATDCSECGFGKFVSAEGTSGAACSDCVMGRYNDQNVLAATVCLACGSGRYTSNVATTSLTDCLLCALGKYFPTNVNSGTCSECPKGWYTDVIGKSICLECPLGKKKKNSFFCSFVFFLKFFSNYF